MSHLATKGMLGPVTVLGAGAWGTALALAALRTPEQGPVTLWARDAGQVADMLAVRRNDKYLPGVALPPALRLSADLSQCLDASRAGLVVIATPMAALEDMLGVLAAHPHARDFDCVWLCKGFQAHTGHLAHEVARKVAPELRTGVLSGPSFAQEVARGQPAALVVASEFEGLPARAVSALHNESLRIYTSEDHTGVEVGGAVKNVLAIATGIADGLALGMNARAALITRGLAEMTRLGVALGALPATFMGLSGLGDLVLTATGDLSRNRQVGLALAKGEKLADILSRLGHVAEGVACAQVVSERAKRSGVPMPLTDAVVSVLAGEQSPQAAVEALMGRAAKAESLH